MIHRWRLRRIMHNDLSRSKKFQKELSFFLASFLIRHLISYVLQRDLSSAFPSWQRPYIILYIILLSRQFLSTIKRRSGTEVTKEKRCLVSSEACRIGWANENRFAIGMLPMQTAQRDVGWQGRVGGRRTDGDWSSLIEVDQPRAQS